MYLVCCGAFLPADRKHDGDDGFVSSVGSQQSFLVVSCIVSCMDKQVLVRCLNVF